MTKKDEAVDAVRAALESECYRPEHAPIVVDALLAAVDERLAFASEPAAPPPVNPHYCPPGNVFRYAERKTTEPEAALQMLRIIARVNREEQANGGADLDIHQELITLLLAHTDLLLYLAGIGIETITRENP